MLNNLQTYLAERIPNAKLHLTPIQNTEVKLWLLNEDYPQHSLTAEQSTALMDNPPYWCFCWASGQVMAEIIASNHGTVAGKNILDFGCGSGIVGIAAALAGAQRVVCCDNDELALQICRENAFANDVVMDFSADLFEFTKTNKCSDWTVCIADVFYDHDNLPLLAFLCAEFGDVWVSDSRTKPEQLKQLQFISEHYSNTIPDLDESEQFRYVKTYRKKI
jgi:predicted nicotinamide N-methyase